MQILKYNARPSDPELTLSYPRDKEDEKSDVLWISQKELFAPSKKISQMPEGELKEALRKQIPVWDRIAGSHSKDNCQWYLKNAYVTFWTEDGTFTISESDFSKEVDDYCFEHIESDVVRFLKDHGCFCVMYMGMLD